MSKEIRLDTVVKLKEREEERARRELADATSVAVKAKEKVAQAHEAAMVEGPRKKVKAALWEMVELSHQRALVQVAQAQAQANVANEGQEAARLKHLAARGKAEAVRRAASAKHEEADSEDRRQERKVLDDVASVLFWRTA